MVMNIRVVGLALVGTVLVVGACDDGRSTPRGSSISTTGERADSADASGCANQDDVVRDMAAYSEQELTGDVDGDGAEDVVSLAIDPEAEPGCRALLVVETRDAVAVAAVDPDAARVQRGLSQPALSFLTELDPRGVEVVVDIEMGASTRFAGVFTLKDEDLRRIDVAGLRIGPVASDPGLEDLFAYGGSVGHIDGAGCARDGDIVVSSATPSGSGADRYQVERRFYALEGATLVPRGRERRVVAARDLDDLPEFTSLPFGSCGLH